MFERQEAITLAEEALREAKIANEIALSQTPIFISSYVDALAKLIDLYLSHGTPKQREKAEELIDDLKSKLGESRIAKADDWRLRQAQMQADRILEKHGCRLATSVRARIWRPATTDNPSIDVAVRLIQHWYREGQLDKAVQGTEAYEQALIDGQLYGFLPQMERDNAAGDEVKRLMEVACDRSRKDKELNGFADSVLLLLMGERERSRERAKDQLAFFRELTSSLKGITDFVPISEYMSGQGAHLPDELIANAADNHGRLHIAFWLGVGELSKGNRAQAAEYFEIAKKTECYNFFAHEWSVIFLEKLQRSKADPKNIWLPWLPREPDSR